MHDKEIRVPADFSGLRLRTPSPYMNQLVETLGATGVRVPGPQVYEALERGVADGTVWVFNAYKSFRLAEVAPKITKIGMTSIPLALVMNKRTYNALPAEDKKAIDDASNRAMSEWMADVMDAYEKEQEEVARNNPKITFTDLSDNELQQWKTALKDAPNLWVERQKQFNVDGQMILEKAQKLSAEAK
jgi:TRAP-type C4-dicarboxylate transport system substrate-binding protein